MPLRLSDAFEQEDGCLECEVTMLNINYGRNQKLMEKCRRLEEYALFIDRVRTLSAKIKDFPSAINQAIDECIYEGVLADLLTEQRAEVHEVILTTFDKELYENGLKEDAYKEGYNEGKTDGFNDGFHNGQVAGSQKKLMEQIQKKLKKGKSIEIIADELEETPELIQTLLSQVALKK